MVSRGRGGSSSSQLAHFLLRIAPMYVKPARALQSICLLAGALPRWLASMPLTPFLSPTPHLCPRSPGHLRFVLLAVDVPSVAGGEQRIYLEGGPSLYERGGVLGVLREPFIRVRGGVRAGKGWEGIVLGRGAESWSYACKCVHASCCCR